MWRHTGQIVAAGTVSNFQSTGSHVARNEEFFEIDQHGPIRTMRRDRDLAVAVSDAVGLHAEHEGVSFHHVYSLATEIGHFIFGK